MLSNHQNSSFFPYIGEVAQKSPTEQCTESGTPHFVLNGMSLPTLSFIKTFPQGSVIYREEEEETW